jgi:hypothetical protein
MKKILLSLFLFFSCYAGISYPQNSDEIQKGAANQYPTGDITKICEEKIKNYCRGLADPGEIKDKQLRDLVIEIKNYVFDIYEKNNSIDWSTHYKKVLTDLRDICIKAGIASAVDWTVNYADGFCMQFNLNYLGRHGLYFDMTFFAYDNRLTASFLLARDASQYGMPGYIDIPDPYNVRVRVDRVLLTNFYIADKFFAEGIGGVSTYVMTKHKSPVIYDSPLIIHNLDKYYNDGVYIFFSLFKLLELHDINIREKIFLDNADVYRVFGTLPENKVLEYKLNYRAWRDEYLKAILENGEERGKVDAFAKKYTDYSISSADIHETAHILKPPDNFSSEALIQFEVDALMVALLSSPDIFKELSTLLRGYYSPYAKQTNEISVSEVLTIVVRGYEDLLKGKNLLNLKERSNDLFKVLEGIDRLSSGDIGIIKQKILNQ